MGLELMVLKIEDFISKSPFLQNKYVKILLQNPFKFIFLTIFSIFNEFLTNFLFKIEKFTKNWRKTGLLVVFLGGESNARIPEAWKCFPDLDSMNMDFGESTAYYPTSLTVY